MDDRSDEARLREYGRDLAAAVDAVIESWVLRCVTDTCAAAGIVVGDRIDAAAREAARRCRSEVADELDALLGSDVDDQTVTPLQVLRRAVRFPAAVLAEAGAPPVSRDDFERRAFPDDVYRLGPAGFADVDPSLRDPGLAWGAAKAHVHQRRHRDG